MLISIGFIGFYIANEIQSSQDNAINDAIGISPLSRYIMSFFEYGVVIISAILIGIWAFRGGHRGILFLQFFYATAGIIGMFRWF